MTSGLPFRCSPLFRRRVERSQRLQLGVERTFQQIVETILIFTFTRSALLIHRSQTPLTNAYRKNAW
jgi:hypothetical protein